MLFTNLLNSILLILETISRRSFLFTSPLCLRYSLAEAVAISYLTLLKLIFFSYSNLTLVA
jgi:hypothetical protein